MRLRTAHSDERGLQAQLTIGFGADLALLILDKEHLAEIGRPEQA